MHVYEHFDLIRISTNKLPKKLKKIPDETKRGKYLGFGSTLFQETKYARSKKSWTSERTVAGYIVTEVFYTLFY